MTNVDARPQRGRMRDDTRDTEIMNATLDLLAETGYNGMTVEMVATRAQAGKGTIYRRWPSKSDLVLNAITGIKPLNAVIPDTVIRLGAATAVLSRFPDTSLVR